MRSGLEASGRFWDEKAGENPYWYVSSFGPYEGRDLADFWASGRRIWNDLKSAIGYWPSCNHRVVEIGCGVGRLTRAIAPEVGRVEALDISEKMLAIAKECNLANVGFHHTDGASLAPVADGSADLAFAYCVFQHLPSEQILGVYLREMVRVTKPGGLIAFTMTPRTMKHWLAPALRLKRRVKEALGSDGARGLYRLEWTGMRPTDRRVRALSPILLSRTIMHGDKWLYYGRRLMALADADGLPHVAHVASASPKSYCFIRSFMRRQNASTSKPICAPGRSNYQMLWIGRS